jgi:hypothetical protein
MPFNYASRALNEWLMTLFAIVPSALNDHVAYALAHMLVC